MSGQLATTRTATCCGNCGRCPGPCVRNRDRKRRTYTRHRFPPLSPAQVIYTYDGSLEGFLSAVFLAFERHEAPEGIVCESGMQTSLLCQTVEVETDLAHAERVRGGISSTLGADEFERVKLAFLSEDPSRGRIILRYIERGMREGRRICTDLADEDVAAFERLWREVSNERHRILQFLRFSKMENGVYFARIGPKVNVVPLIMEHFSQRFNTQPFLIYDEVHDIAGVWDLKEWYLLRTDTLTIPNLHEDEQRYRAMWKTFYDRVCNESRYNPRLRMNFMPKRLWSNITEMDPTIQTANATGKAQTVDAGIAHF